MEFQFDAGGLDFCSISAEDILFPPLLEDNSVKRDAEEITQATSSPIPEEASLSFPEKVVGRQMKEISQTAAVSKSTSVYLSAIMEGIAKYVLDEAGKEGEQPILPEGDFIRVDDVKKVLSSIGVSETDEDVYSRLFLQGTSMCIDSMSDSLLQQAIDSVSNYFKDFVNMEVLSVTPSPLLQDCLVKRFSSDESVLFITYCERVSTALQLLPKSNRILLIPRSLRLLLAVIMSRGKERHQSLVTLREYVNSFHNTTSFTVDIYIDSEDNASYYADYNTYRRNKASGKDLITISSLRTHLFKLEIEQFICFKILRDLLQQKWVITVPRYCKLEGWEYEQMMKIAMGKVPDFQKCSVSLEFGVKSLDSHGKVVYSDTRSVLKKYSSLKRFHYVSPWNNDSTTEKNQIVLCNLGLLCFCPIEVIPVLYHHLYYQCQLVLFTSLPENHPSIRNIVDLLRSAMI